MDWGALKGRCEKGSTADSSSAHDRFHHNDTSTSGKMFNRNAAGSFEFLTLRLSRPARRLD